MLLATLVIGSVLGGVLWKYHDMQAGYFPDGSRMSADFLWGAWTGLWIGPVIVLLSIPLNVLALISGYAVTHRVPIFLKSYSGGKV